MNTSRSLLIIFCFLSINVFGQSSYIDKKGNAHLWGKCMIEDFNSSEYKEWYDKNYNDFELNNTNRLNEESLKDYKVQIFIGTWCGDTKYLFPRFMKLWNGLNLDNGKLEIIALHNEDELYKMGPKKETEGLNIHRVPTFIFSKDGKEQGRIVERTVFDLETDINCIVSGYPYKPHYNAVQILSDYLETANLDSLRAYSSLKAGYNSIYRDLSTSGELNTYGFVLMSENRFDEAEFVFKVNRYLFPFDPNVRDSYGEALLKNGFIEEAKKEYLESVRINPKNENGFEQLTKINEMLKQKKENESKNIE